ncbi:MAG: molybdenum cofactor guanylyltransferase [Photobacterium aquimaris]|nr:molybdenum cofactor guanylyltransferase [Photobacterium aquimaris]
MNYINSTSDCLGVVLAGGLSSRMGQDKAQLQRNNSSMLEFSQHVIKASGINNVVISGNGHQVPDLIEKAGPVGGIYSVLAQFQPKSLLILPVDLPLMTAGALTKLRRAGELSQKATFFIDTHGKHHNIPLFLPNNAYLTLFLNQAFKATSHPQANQTNKKKGPSIKALLQQVPNQSVSLARNTQGGSALFNSNTPQDWQQAQQQFT